LRAAGRLFRRTLLSHLAFGIAAGFTATTVQVEQKLSQADAEYQDGPKNGLTCAACSLFRRPRSCEVVEGDISPNGRWCKFFDLPG
jgi:hypothetical protein